MDIQLSQLSCDPSECDAVLTGAEQTNPALRDPPGLHSLYCGVDRAPAPCAVGVSIRDARKHDKLLA